MNAQRQRIINMKTITLFILLFISSSSFGCLISPYQRTAMNAEKLKELSDIIFFGKLVKFDIKPNGKQVATFTVIKSLKGDVDGHIQIRNEEISSCFRVFKTIDSAYYLFATKSNIPGQYEITSSNSNGFIPLEWAVEHDWSFKK